MGPKRLEGQARSHQQAGFSLIEVLVVVVIIGILSAIALPALLKQRDQAGDADAKSLARGAAGVLESHAASTNSYDLSRAEILEEAPELATARAWTSDTTPTHFDVTVTSDSGITFTVQRDFGTSAIRTCSPPDRGGCPSDGIW